MSAGADIVAYWLWGSGAVSDWAGVVVECAGCASEELTDCGPSVVPEIFGSAELPFGTRIFLYFVVIFTRLWLCFRTYLA